MNRYETVFILTPVLSDDQMKEAVEKFKDVLKQNDATLVNEELWGLRRDERVIRFLTFRLDKYAAEYAEKRRRLRAEKPQVQPAEAEAEATETKEA